MSDLSNFLSINIILIIIINKIVSPYISYFIVFQIRPTDPAPIQHKNKASRF